MCCMFVRLELMVVRSFVPFIAHRVLRMTCAGLFTDTKPGKHIPQQFIIRDLAGDLAKVVQGLPDINGDEIGGNTGFKTIIYAGDGFKHST